MGVHYFFPWIKQQCSQCILQTAPVSSGSILLFDMNGMLYGARKTPKEACQDVMEIVKKRIFEFRAEIIVLAIDGVAPKAKRWQQRKRRFLNPENNNLSVGTHFMDELDREFVNYLENNRMCKTVFYSGPSVAGEGEHKLFRFINHFRWKEEKFIFGVDGDLLMLALLSAESKIYVIRPVFMRPKLVEIVDVDCLRRYVTGRFANTSSFVCFANVLGNDFLPSVEPFDTRDTFETFLKTVEHVKLVSEDGIINWNSLSDRVSFTKQGKSFAVGMQWILEYYTQKKHIEKIDWYYPYNDRPSWQEIGVEFKQETVFVDEVELDPLFQLFFILPKVSVFLLPEPLQIVYAESFSVVLKKRKKRPAWDVDYIMDINDRIDLTKLYKLVKNLIENKNGKVLKFETITL